MWEQAHDPNRDAKHIGSFNSEFFVNPRCPPGSSSVLSVVELVETTEEDSPTKGLLAAEGGVDIPSGPPASPDMATEGSGLKLLYLSSFLFCTLTS